MDFVGWRSHGWLSSCDFLETPYDREAHKLFNIVKNPKNL